MYHNKKNVIQYFLERHSLKHLMTHACCALARILKYVGVTHNSYTCITVNFILVILHKKLCVCKKFL